MTSYESTIKSIPFSQEKVFDKLADLRNLETLKDKIPASAGISDLSCEEDVVRFNIQAAGKIALRIVDREAPKTIKFNAENSPIAFNMWIQLVGGEANDTKIKVTLKADLPAMIKMMLGSKLEQFVDQFAEGLSKIDY